MFNAALLLSFASFSAFSRSITALALTAALALIIASIWIFLFGSVAPEVPITPPSTTPTPPTRANLMLYRYTSLRGSEQGVVWPNDLPTIIAATGCYDRRRVSAVTRAGPLPTGGQVLPVRIGARPVSTGAMVVGLGYGLGLQPRACYEGPGSTWFDFAAAQTFSLVGGRFGVIVNVVDATAPEKFLNEIEATFGGSPPKAAIVLLTLPLASAKTDPVAYQAFLSSHLSSWTVAPAPPAFQSDALASAWVAANEATIGVEPGSMAGFISPSGAAIGVSCILQIK